jgi:hypothetical protein
MLLRKDKPYVFLVGVWRWINNGCIIIITSSAEFNKDTL